jgi:hypothetical protein
MTDSKIKVQDVVDKWLLLTYDLPHSEEGDKARALFLARAAAIGATRHTTRFIYSRGSSGGGSFSLEYFQGRRRSVIAWAKSRTFDEQRGDYPELRNGLKALLKNKGVRLDKMDAYSFSNSRERVIQMTPKKKRLLDNAEAAIIRRGNDVLFSGWKFLKPDLLKSQGEHNILFAGVGIPSGK